MPRRLTACHRHRQRQKRLLGVFAGVTYRPAPWWPALLAEVQRIVRESGEPAAFDAEQWLSDFLRAPSPALGGRTPLQLLDTDEGLAHVQRLIGQMQSGAYA